MARVFIIGAGVAGCTAAYTLAENGVDVILIEKSDAIGGKARSYGCKAIDKCQNCGVCLTGGLWKRVLDNPRIKCKANFEIVDIKGCPGNFEVFAGSLIDPGDKISENNIDAIIVCTGFEVDTKHYSSHLHINISGSAGIITGDRLETMMQSRTDTVLFDTALLDTAPEGVAFIQCVSSRDINESGIYCSRVCCSYTTRIAKVIRSYYPECEIVFFYMELQNVAPGDYYSGLCELDIEFIKCRPVKVSGGKPAVIEYEDRSGGAYGQ